jgi:hypothetical protein
MERTAAESAQLTLAQIFDDRSKPDPIYGPLTVHFLKHIKFHLAKYDHKTVFASVAMALYSAMGYPPDEAGKPMDEEEEVWARMLLSDQVGPAKSRQASSRVRKL